MAKVYTKVSAISAATIAVLKSVLSIVTGKQGTVTGNTSGNARGNNAVDFQLTRSNSDQIAGGDNSFIAGGADNSIIKIIDRDSDPYAGHAEGYSNIVTDWQGHAEGSHCYVDGKISHAEGNTVIVSGNDSHGEGNRTAVGRRYYQLTVYGSEDAGDDLGVLQYALIPDIEGNVTSFFPNALFNDVTARYGAGATMDDRGNIYPVGMTKAVWDGSTLVTANNLRWAMHSICILRGPKEIDIKPVHIKKATYEAGVGTKVYYEGSNPFASLAGIYSSYAPTVAVNGAANIAGNGMHTEGLFTNAWGYGAHAEGYLTRAWGRYSHAEGQATTALGLASQSSGRDSLSLRDYQKSYAGGKRSKVGDSQVFDIIYSRSCAGAGWWQVYLLENCQDGMAYHFETMVLGRQISGSAGSIGDTFAYKFNGCFIRNGSVYTVLGTPVITLIGRSASLSGDGLTTGIRIAWKAPDAAANRAELRYDGLADTTYWIQTYSKIQEVSIL